MQKKTVQQLNLKSENTESGNLRVCIFCENIFYPFRRNPKN